MTNLPGWLADFLEDRIACNPSQAEFHQAMTGVTSTVVPLLDTRPELRTRAILERLYEPERQIMFRVPWQDDRGVVRVQRGYRTQFNSALGPYKGGLRFQAGLSLGTINFLAFEQTFKNSLTGLQLGGAKGGADFNPKGRSDEEVMRFCQSFMLELSRHIGHDIDVPAGDMGVSEREIGYLFGAYKRLANRYEAGVLTGKSPNWGGSLARPEATGYGLAFFSRDLLATRGRDLDELRCVVSGAGNVSIHAIEKLQQLGATVVACSDTNGAVLDDAGLDLDLLKEVKIHQRASLSTYADRRSGATYEPGTSVWRIPCDAAFPCATQNELDEGDARWLVDHGCTLVAEGANMPCTNEAVDLFREAGILYGPAIAANAGGVATSGFEMEQNAGRDMWSFDQVEKRLEAVMGAIHDRCRETADRFGTPGDYLAGANIAGLERVADAMLELGVI
jgi:glutamate dehydrogenase (NADP+)